MLRTPDPKLIALILCDQVIEDIRTRKKSYIGVFDSISIPKTPMRIRELSVVVVLTDCKGKQKIKLQILKNTDEHEESIIEIVGELSSNDPLGMVDLVFNLRGVSLDKFGKYTIRVSSVDSNDVIGYRYFQVTEIGGKP